METISGIMVSNSELEPRDDTEFDSHDAAYEYYKDYAKYVGFGTAKLSSRRSRASKEFIDAKFSCIRYGNKQQSDDAINPRPSPKIGCKASMHVKRRQNGTWYVHSFVREHNHELLPAQAHFFRSHRNVDSVNNDNKIRKKNVLASSLKQNSAYQFLGSCSNGVLHNQIERGRYLSLEEGGAQILLEFCVQMHEDDPKFFHALDFNEEHQLRSIFWVHSKGIEDFTHFCDVVSLDHTYMKRKYKVPLVLFIGVNHHIQPTLLGFGLIADETYYMFLWLMQSWRLAMGGKCPKVLLTDENEAVKAAVLHVFPDTCHFFHLWDILEKIPRRLDYHGIWRDTFIGKFNKCINRSHCEEKFQKKWCKLLDRFNLREDEWFLALYGECKRWVPALFRDVSFAGLHAASRSESLNSFFDQYVNGETSLRDFTEQYKSILEDIHEKEAKANFDAWHESPDLKSPSPFEKQMSLVYSHELFKKFQIEVLGAAACHLKKEEGSSVIYIVKDFENNQEYRVELDEVKSVVVCSCLSFEYKGYLCRHAIVVLQMSGVFSIPQKYILKRWTNAATSRLPLANKLDEVQAKIRRYNNLCRRAIVLGEEGSLSQESYNSAVKSISKALKQCGSYPSDNDPRLSISAPLAIQVTMHGVTDTFGDQIPKSKVTTANKGFKRCNYEKESGCYGIVARRKRKDVSGSPDHSISNPTFLTTLLKGGEVSERSVEMLGEMLEEQI